MSTPVGKFDLALLDQIPRVVVSDVNVLATLLKRRVIRKTDSPLVIAAAVWPMYSASVLDSATDCCLVDFHATGPPAMRTT